jgi:hypothetical protein
MLISASLCAQGPNSLSKEEMKDGWTLLFNGHSTAGWHRYGHATGGSDAGSQWVVLDGSITPDKSKPGHGDLVTDDTYDNFDLKLEWKISRGGNSGVLFYVQEDTVKYKEPYFTGPEMQVLDNDVNNDGKIKTHRAGDLYDLISCSTETVKPVGEWNQVEIICNHGELKLFLNGTNVVTTRMDNENWKAMVAHSKFKRWPDFAVTHSGHIDLQDHDFPVWYRNIRIKKL